MTQQSKYTPGPLRAYERNTDPMNWAIRDANNHMVAEHIPKQLALLFVKALEMYELLRTFKNMVREWEQIIGTEEENSTPADTLEKTKAAIAKAERRD